MKLLACVLVAVSLLVVSSTATRLRHEEVKTLKTMGRAKALVWDDSNRALYVGGASHEDLDLGAIMILTMSDELKPKKKISVEMPEDSSAILSGGLHKGKIYFGTASGAIYVLDTEEQKIVRTIDPEPGRFDISHIVSDGDEGLFMAFRRTAGDISNWCYQEHFVAETLKSYPDQFSGHFPGPCTSLIPDFKRKELYWTDSSWRGRWNSLSDASKRVESMWENGKTVTSAALLKGVLYVMNTRGKIDGFPQETFDKEGGPPEDLTATIDLGDEISGGQWKVLIADEARESLWAGNDEGVLVEVSPKLHVDAILKKVDDGYKFENGGILIEGKLVMIDTAKPLTSKISIMSFASTCVLGSEYQCKCKKSEDFDETKMLVCSVNNRLVVEDLLQIPENVILRTNHDIIFKAGAELRVGLTSKIVTTGSITMDGLVLSVNDRRKKPPVGAFDLVSASGGIDGSVKSAGLTKAMVISRIFFCAQIPRLSVSMKQEDGSVVLVHTASGKCRSPMVTLPFVFFIVGGILYIALFFKNGEKKLESKIK